MVKVSILLPVYNNKKDVLNAIRSVIQQTYGDWELIIVDDCSTDGSFELIKQYIRNKGVVLGGKLRLYRNVKNSGCYVSLNKGITKSRGKYITRIDSDDTYHINKLQKQVFALDNNDAVVAVNIKFSREGSGPINGEIGLMFRRCVIKKIGYYDSVRFAADSEFKARLYRTYNKNKILALPDVLYYAKRRANSLTTSAITGGRGRSETGFAIRLDYVAKYRKWHNDNRKNLFMKFPMKINERPFVVNVVMLP